ncbi:MAG: hypothetical protein Sapg2KO_28890 [Saprospiraceae bacterium]
MSYMKRARLIIWLCLIFNTLGYAQNFSPDFNLLDTSQIHILETKKGDRFIGKVLKIEQTTLTFLFRPKQELAFEFSELKRVSVYSGVKNTASFQPTYLTIFPTAYNYKQGEWEYQNVDLLWNTLNYGVSDNFSVGGGFIIPFAFLARFKWSTPVSETLQIALNAQSLVPLIEDSTSPFSIISLTGTIGVPDRFLNLGVGYGFDWSSTESAIFLTSLGGNVHISERVGFNGELDLGISEGNVFIFPSVSMSYFGKQNRLSLGFVLDRSLEFLGLLGLPLVSYNQRF